MRRRSARLRQSSVASWSRRCAPSGQESGPHVLRTATISEKLSFAALLCFLLQPACALTEEPDAKREGIDTEHIYGFMIGTDVGDPGEREFQSTLTGRFSKQGGNYTALDQQLEMEFVPFRNFRVEVGTTFAAFEVSSVPGLANLTQSGWQGASLDLRYKLLDRQTAPFGLTVALENHGNRFDDISGLGVRNYGTELTLVLERDVIPNLAVATLNLGYQPEWTRSWAWQPSSRTPRSPWHLPSWRRCVPASCLAAKRAISANMTGSAWANWQAKPSSWGRPPISSFRSAHA